MSTDLLPLEQPSRAQQGNKRDGRSAHTWARTADAKQTRARGLATPGVRSCWNTGSPFSNTSKELPELPQFLPTSYKPGMRAAQRSPVSGSRGHNFQGQIWPMAQSSVAGFSTAPRQLSHPFPASPLATKVQGAPLASSKQQPARPTHLMRVKAYSK